MKVTRNVLRYILSCLLIPGVTWASGSDAAGETKATQELGGAVIDWVDGLFPNLVYHTKTYEIHKTSDMEKGLDMKVNATFKLYTDITVNEDSLYTGLVEMERNKAWTERHLYDRINATFQSAGNEKYSLTFDGGSDDSGGILSRENSVGQVLNWGQYEFNNLDQITFRDICNAKCDENLSYKSIVSANLLAGGVLGANDSLIKSYPGAKAGVKFTENNSILFSNIKADLQGEGDLVSNVTALGGAIFTVKGTTSFTYNDGDIRFENIEIYSNTKGDIPINKTGLFEGAGGAIFTNGLTMDDNDGSVIFDHVGVYQEDDDLLIVNGLLKVSVTSGGAIYMVGDGSISDNSGNVVFTNCYSVGGNLAWGGAIHLGAIPSTIMEALTLSPGGTFTISDNGGEVRFHDNRVAVEGLPDATEASRALGGAVKISGGYVFDVSDNKGGVSFLRNRAELSGRADSLLNPVYIADGGAIYAGYSLTSMLQSSEVNIYWNEGDKVAFNENFAAGRGGAIFGDSYSTVSIRENSAAVEFCGNTTASGAGGAVYMAGDAKFSVVYNSKGVTFDGNKSGTDPNIIAEGKNNVLAGGAVFLADKAIGGNSGAVLELLNNGSVTFRNNEAAGHGGAVYGAEGTLINISDNGDVLFSGNKAGALGEAIYTRGDLIISGNDSVTFTGHDGHAVYMSRDAGSGTAPNLEISAEGGTVLFDNDSLYAESTDSNRLRVLFNKNYGGDIIFRGSDAGLEVVDGELQVGTGNLVLEDGADLTADTFTFLETTDYAVDSLILKNSSSSTSVVVNTNTLVMGSNTLKAVGVNNLVNGELRLSGASTLHLTAGLANLATVSQNNGSGLEADGAAVLTLTGGLNLTQNKLNLQVYADNGIASAENAGVYSLLKLTDSEFDMDLWNTDRVSVSGDAIFSDLRWNRSHNQLFYVYSEEAHAGDRVWTNHAGGSEWDYEARNWMTALEEIDGVRYRDKTLGDNAAPIGVQFTDACTDATDVVIADDVAPRDITVNATRDYTFVDGGGKITGTGTLYKKGTGMLTLALENDFTGGVRVEQGTLNVLNGKALGTGGVILEKDAKLRLDHNTHLTLSGSAHRIEGNLEVAQGSYLKLDFTGNGSGNGWMYAGDCHIEGTLELSGSGVLYGTNAASLVTRFIGSGLVELSGTNNAFTVAGVELSSNYESLFNGTLKVSGSNNILRFAQQGYRGAGQLIVDGSGNEIKMHYSDAWGSAALNTYMMDGGLLELRDGGKLSAGRVVMESGSVLKASGVGNRIEIKGANSMQDYLWFLYDSTLDITVGAGNALSDNNEDAVLVVDGNTLFGADSIDDSSEPGEGDRMFLNVKVDDYTALRADTSYVLMRSDDSYGIPLKPYGEAYWNEQLIQVGGDAVFSDLGWDESGSKLLFNTPDAVVWRDFSGNGVWNVEADRNWKRFTAANADVFKNGDNVRFMDTCESDSPVLITQEVNVDSILVKADRDYTFADGGGKITGTGGILKQGSGTLSIALDNDFSGGVVLEEGTLRLQADRALGSGALTARESGTSLVVENWSNVSLAEGSDVQNSVEVARGAMLKVGANSVFRAQEIQLDGKLVITDYFNAGRTESLSGSGELRFSSNEAIFSVVKNDGFTGSFSLLGNAPWDSAGNTLNVSGGGYSGAGTFSLAAYNKIFFQGEGDEGKVEMKAGGQVILKGDAKLSASSVQFDSGASLILSGTGNDMVTPSTSAQSDDRVIFRNGSMLDIEVCGANALSGNGYTEAGLILHGIPEFGAITLTLSAGEGVDGGNTYTLISLAEDKGVTNISPSYWTSSNWNENLIQVAGIGSFADLSWVESGGVCKLVYNAPDIICWSNADGTGKWNVSLDYNWNDFFSGNEEVYLDDKKVYFGDECTSPDAVSIVEKVRPGIIMVEAERDYTFADGGGSIAGAAQLVKRGSGTLTIALDNEFTGGVELQEGELRVHADKALGSGALHAAADTSLVVENGATLDLSATSGTLAGNVKVAENAALQMQIRDGSSYTAQNTELNGSLELSAAQGNQTAGTESLSGSGRLELAAGGGSLAFTVQKNDGFNGDLAAGGAGNSIAVQEGGYEGSGTISAYDGGSISFSGQSVRMLDGGVLSADAGSSLEADSFFLGAGAELVADSGVAVFTARDGSAITGTQVIESITAEVVTLDGGSFLVQHGSYYSMANVLSLVFDGSNGQAITLSTDLAAEERGGSTWYILFSDVRDYSMQGDLTFAIVGEEESTQIRLAAVEQENGYKTLYLVASVPEPTTVSLSLLALAGLLARRRRH